MTYPSGAEFTIGYGCDTGICPESGISRPAEMSFDGKAIFDFTYSGTGSTLAKTYGNNLFTADFRNGGMDRFGRVTEINYGLSNNNHVYGYGDDQRGSRLYSKIDTPSHANDQSYLYRYDDLNRLVEAYRGSVDDSQADPTISPSPSATILGQKWTLDPLGNRNGGNANTTGRPLPGYIEFDDGGQFGVYDDGTNQVTVTEHHDTNEIESRTVDGLSTEFYHDPAGNLVFDGEHYFVYDAWNRVVDVHTPGSLKVINDELTGKAGDLIAHYDYDALGRRIRKVVRDGSSPHNTTSAGDVFYYDGHRVIEHHKLDTVPTARLVSSGTAHGRVSEDIPANRSIPALERLRATRLGHRQ